MFGPFTIGELTDPVELERSRLVHEAADRNFEWLGAHWQDLLPQALGKFVAVSGQEAFLADDSVAALALARAAHPEDSGAIVQYVRPEKGLRIYSQALGRTAEVDL